MNRSIIISSVLHLLLILVTAMSLPFLAKKPLDIPPIVSVELIQIAEKTNIPFAPKAKKIIEKVKEKEKKLVSEQAPPKKVKKTKTKTVVSVEQNEKVDNKTPEAQFVHMLDKLDMALQAQVYAKEGHTEEFIDSARPYIPKEWLHLLNLK